MEIYMIDGDTYVCMCIYICHESILVHDDVSATPDNSGQLRPTPDHSGQLRTTPGQPPGNSGQLRPGNSGQLPGNLRATPDNSRQLWTTLHNSLQPTQPSYPRD